MQTDDMDFTSSPLMLDTPSLTTPNIGATINPLRTTYNPMPSDYSNNVDQTSVSNPSSIRTVGTGSHSESSSASSADVKVSQIEDVLKAVVSEQRRPTTSPFAKIISGQIPIPKMLYAVPNDDGTMTEVPSTADVILAVESLTNSSTEKLLPKAVNTETIERELNATIAENNRYDPSSGSNLGTIVSPKKNFLLRSQSITEMIPSGQTNANPNNNNSSSSNVSLSRKSNNESQSSLTSQNGFNEESSMDESIHHQFERIQDSVPLTHLNGTNVNNAHVFKSTVENENESSFTDSNGMAPHHNTLTKQSVVVQANKRTFQQTITSNHPSGMIAKANSHHIPTSSSLINEVTSSDQSSHVKRQKTSSMPTNAALLNFGPSPPTNNVASALSPNANLPSDDVRKKQIRDSNREAARRCRERRRNYIEQLEGNLEQAKTQIKQLTEKVTRVERENLRLHALISEAKLPHPNSRLSSSESMTEFVNVITAAGLDLNSESSNHQTDATSLARNYLNRNNL